MKSSSSKAAIPIEYTDQQKIDFQEQFAARRKRLRISIVPTVAFLVALRFFDNHLDRSDLRLPAAVLILFFAYIVGFVMFRLRNWRCPACNGYLATP